MKLAAINVQGKEQIGLYEEEKMYHLNALEISLLKYGTLPTTLLEGIEQGEVFVHRVEEIQRLLHNCWDCNIHALDATEYELLAPISRPKKNIICVGKNYVEHALEMGSTEDIPVVPMFFTKAPTTVIGTNIEIDAHWDVTSELDYEGELAVIIGKRTKCISAEEALEAVFGYTIINDISARDIQMKHKQFFFGKSFDTYCPMGPLVVSASEIKNPNYLTVVTKVNGEIRQDGRTKDMIFSVAQLIATLSQGMTLEPGDILATGTPAGVGKGFKPPRYLKRGDVVEVTIEGIGTLTNMVK